MEKNKRIFSGFKKDQKSLDPLIKNHVTHQHGQKKLGVDPTDDRFNPKPAKTTDPVLVFRPKIGPSHS